MSNINDPTPSEVYMTMLSIKTVSSFPERHYVNINEQKQIKINLPSLKLPQISIDK